MSVYSFYSVLYSKSSGEADGSSVYLVHCFVDALVRTLKVTEPESWDTLGKPGSPGKGY